MSKIPERGNEGERKTARAYTKKAGLVRMAVSAMLAIGLGVWLWAERGKLLRASTWKSLRAAGWRNVLNLNALHLYIYGRWTNQYLAVALNFFAPRLNKQDRQAWVDHYHGKVLTQDQAEAIVTLDHNC